MWLRTFFFFLPRVSTFARWRRETPRLEIIPVDPKILRLLQHELQSTETAAHDGGIGLHITREIVTFFYQFPLAAEIDKRQFTEMAFIAR